jgi:adenosylhomocysteine nucleosidase
MPTVGRMRSRPDRIGTDARRKVKTMSFAADPSSAPGPADSWPAAVEAGLVDPAAPELPSADAADARPLPQPGAGQLGVVTALQAEADCLRESPEGSSPLIYVSGGSVLRARAGAEELRAKGVVGLVSFGLAIGLAPVLRPGDVVVAESVVLPSGKSIATHAAWRAALLQRLSGSGLNVRAARIAGSDEMLASSGAKRRAFQATFAAALDTDSHAVAEVAAAAGLPLLVVRAVAEPAEEMRPAIAFAANGVDGQPRSLAVVGLLAKRPWEIPAAWRFSKNGRMALDALRRVAGVGPGPLAFGAM